MIQTHQLENDMLATTNWGRHSVSRSILLVRRPLHSQTFSLTWPIDTIDTAVQNKTMTLRYAPR